MSTHAPVVLGHLAATGWFAAHGEVALTGGLAFCLQKDRAAARAFVELIRTRTGHTAEQLPVPDRWEAESGDPAGWRVDVAGWQEVDSISVPIVFVEAKVSAGFAPRQVSTYVESQQESVREAEAPGGALAVLVPEASVRTARERVADDLGRLGATPDERCWVVHGEPRVAVTVISWDEAIRHMLEQADPAAGDLEQLHGACQALQGADVAALTEADLDGGWRNRKEDLRFIIGRVTEEAIARLSLPLAPWQANPSGGLEGGFRYLAPSALPNLAVGMRLDETGPPLWVRWHQRTADIGLVERRLTEAGRTPQRHEGHLWLPLGIKPDSGSATCQIDRLVSQVVDLYNIAVGRIDSA